MEVGGVRLLKALLLYGSNGSGKTNVLYALDFLRSVAFKIPRNIDDFFKYKQFAFDPAYKNKETSFNLFFFIGNTRYNYQLSLTPEYISREEMRQYHKGNQSRRVFLREYDVESSKNSVKFGPWVGLSTKDKQAIEEATTRIVSVLAAYSIRNISSDLLTEIRDYFKYHFFHIYNLERSDEEVAKALQHDPSLREFLIKMMKSFHSNIVDVQVEETNQPVPEEARKLLLQMNGDDFDKEEIAKFTTIQSFKTHYIHKTPYGEFLLEDNLQSEGTLAFIRCLTLFYKAIKGNWMLALDEFGAGIQAKSQNLLLNFFLKFSQRAQLIVATQSIGLLDNEQIRRDGIAIVSKDDIGQTKVDQDVVRKIHKNIKLRQAYRTGKFISINPNEPDIDLNTECESIRSLLFAT
ncbi:MAG: ATP-binding protein [Lachnospiraceae bacterium]|nr:ATP-binding protein [Lachnospiraceae bacterium]